MKLRVKKPIYSSTIIRIRACQVEIAEAAHTSCVPTPLGSGTVECVQAGESTFERPPDTQPTTHVGTGRYIPPGARSSRP